MRTQKVKSWAILLLCLLVPLFSAMPAASQAPTGSGDDSRWEVGVEYVNWYTGAPDLSRTDDDALGLYNVLGGGGWTRNFAYGNGLAWEEDWKASWRTGGGTEYGYVDAVDLAYFSGHGGSAWDSYYGRYLYGPVFGDGGNTHDDPYLVPGDARRAYGDGDVEWMAFSACQTLNDSSFGYWANAMYGMHLLLGFATNMWDVNQGDPFGWRIRWGWTIPQAWFGATDVTHPQWAAKARILANEPCHYYYDRYGSTCADSYDWDFWYADHWAGSEPALQVDPAALDYQMPVLNVIAPAPSEDELLSLASAFGFGAGVPATLDPETELYRIADDTLDLTVDQQGLFYFLNGEQLWSAPAGTTTVDRQAPLAPEDAREIADAFLTANDLLPPDAAFFEVISDTLTGITLAEVPTSGSSPLGVTETYTDVQVTISDTVATAQQVIYSRHIEYTPADGTPVTVSVQGPGARLKVYVSNDGQVIGSMGGWRTVDDLGVLDTVEIVTPGQMAQLYEQLGSMVELTSIPYKTDAITITASTVGYYEQPLGTEQNVLTPVYVLSLDLDDPASDQPLQSATYVPASPALMNPLAAVTSHADDTPPILVGDVLALEAADASSNLSDLGYGQDLTFALGQGPYTYEWSNGATGRVLGTGRTLDHEVTFQDYAGLGRDYDVPLQVVLTVTDAAGQTSRTLRNFYFAQTLVVHRTYVPIIMQR